MVDRTIAQGAETTKGKISFEAYLRMYDGEHAEWIDGEVVVYMSSSTAHQKLVGWLYVLIFMYLSQRPIGTVLHAPYAMKISKAPHGREPDILFVSNAHQKRIKANYLDGPPDLVVEVVSPESIEHDYKTKFSEYEKGGIPEYLLIDPLEQKAFLYRLGADKRYQLVAPDANGDLLSEMIPGFRLPVAMLWQDPPPDGQQIIAYVQKMVACNT